MRKWMLKLGSILVVISLLFGCASEDNNNNDQVTTNNNQEEASENNSETSQNEDLVSITISMDNGEEVIEEKEVPIEDGAILMDVLKEHFNIEEDSGFIQSIEGESQDEDEGKYWLYTVNGEDAMVGANEYELTHGDEVVFDLHSVE